MPDSVQCACGCGRTVRPGRTYVQGHNSQKPRVDACRIDGCTREPHYVDARLCSLHYGRILRYGRAERAESGWATVEDRLRGRSVRVDGCLRWTGAHTKTGYGQITINDKRVSVHRAAYTVWVGAIPDGLDIDHVASRGCNHRDCIEPNHLEAVTHAENLRRVRHDR